MLDSRCEKNIPWTRVELVNAGASRLSNRDPQSALEDPRETADFLHEREREREDVRPMTYGVVAIHYRGKR